MSYVDTNLISGEAIVYRARPHWAVMAPAVAVGSVLDLVATALLIAAFVWQGAKGWASVPLAVMAAVLAVIGSTWVAVAMIQRGATEIAVTNRRVLVKTGLVSRHTTEILLSKIESVAIEESVAGRMLGYGKVMIHGTGGTPEVFDRIERPADFRRQVQSQIDELPTTAAWIQRIA